MNENGYGGRCTLPYVFTEQGISLLASVLHSNVELKQLEYQKQTDEKLEKIFEYIYEHEEASQKVFFDGQIYDTFSLIVSLIQKAEKKITLIDGYVDVGTMNLLSKKNENVSVTIYTQKRTRLT